MRTRPAPRTFRSGELAPWLDGITNELTQQGCRTLENFIVRKQGQITRRPGTFFVNEVKDSADTTVLVPVTIDDDNSYVLEIGDAYIRFYKNHARITYAGTTTIYEVTSPWSTGDVSDLRWTYVPNDKALYFAHPEYAVRKLTWTSDASWTMNELPVWAVSPVVVFNSRGQAMLSEDGENWVFSRLSTYQVVGDVVRGKDNYIVATTSNTIWISNDGETWEKTLDVAGFGYNRVGLAANPVGDIVFVGGFTSGFIYTSHDDGVTWEQKAIPQSLNSYYKVAYDPDNNYFRTAGLSVGAYSQDGDTWTSIPEITNGVPEQIVYANQLWLRVGDNTKIYRAASVASPWTVAESITGIAFTGATYGEPDGSPLWLALRANGATSGLVYYSSTGSAWTLAQAIQGEPYHGIWSKHRFFAFNYNLGAAAYENLYWTSDTGLSWTTHTISANYARRAKFPAVSRDDTLEWFSTSNAFPGCITFHEGRLLLAGTSEKPATIWGSKVNQLNNFYLGEFADNAFSYNLASDRNADIQWIVGGFGGLVVGSRTAEGIMLGSQEEGITPNTAQFRWLSTFGSANIQPVRVNNAIVFVQRGGEIVRGYVPQANAYESPELTFYADHIGDGGLTSIDRQEDPQNIVYFVRSDGQVPALTMETGLVAWSRIKTASTSLSVGIVESIAVIPTGGAEDEVWQIVNRKVTAGTKRYIEYYDSLAVSSIADAHYVDCGVNPTSTVTFANVGALTHLAGEVVDALIDGTRWVAGLAVPASGTIALAPYSGTNIHVGLPYRSYVQTMRGDYGSPWGDGAGLNKRTNDLLVWVHDSSALAKFGPKQSDMMVDRGDCESATSPMVRGESVPANSNVTWAQDATEAYTGASSYKFTKTAASGAEARVGLTGPESTTNMHGFLPGQTVTITMRIKVPSASGMLAEEASFRIMDYADGNYESTSASVAGIYDTWQTITITRTLRSNCTGVIIRVRPANAMALNEYFYVDDIEIFAGDTSPETIAYPSSTTLVTDVMKVNFPGQWDRDNYIWCMIADPRPFTLVAMAPDSETGDR